MLPDSIPESVWSEFRAHRRKLKRPMTDYAETLILCKLEKWRVESGANPIDIINHSIEMGWQGVFLNGYARQGTTTPALTSANGKDSAVCASCNKPLLSGFVHSRKGRVHPDCI